MILISARWILGRAAENAMAWGGMPQPLPHRHATIRVTAHCSLLTAHYSLLSAHYSQLATRYSLLIAHYSLLTTHDSLLTTNHSPLTTHHSPLTTRHSLLVPHHSPLITHSSLLIAHCSLLAAHYSCSPPTTHYPLPDTTHRSLLATRARQAIEMTHPEAVISVSTLRSLHQRFLAVAERAVNSFDQRSAVDDGVAAMPVVSISCDAIATRTIV